MVICAVVPTYNEAGNIEKLVRTLRAAVPDGRLLVVDDQSPDGTAQLVKRLQSDFTGLELLVRPGKLGFGTAISMAFAACSKIAPSRPCG